MIKEKAKFKICLDEEPLTNLSDLRESFMEQNYLIVFKNHKN
jgi:hypothetical protein